MSEEQKSKADQKTADRDFLRALSPEQLSAMDGIGIVPESIPNEHRPAVLAMTPELVVSHLNMGRALKKARRLNAALEKTIKWLKIASFLAVSWVCVVLAQTIFTDWAGYLCSFAFAAFGYATLRIFDATLPQFDLDEILKNPVWAMVFTGYVTLLICAGFISGAGSLSLNGGGTRPGEPQQEQVADTAAPGLSQKSRDILNGTNPPYREGNEPKRNSQSDNYQ